MGISRSRYRSTSMAEASAATTIDEMPIVLVYSLPVTHIFRKHPTERCGRAWRRQAPPLLYTLCPSYAYIVVAALASAMPGSTTDVALCICHQGPSRFTSGFTTFG